MSRLLLHGGAVFDGTGADPRPADVVIEGDRLMIDGLDPRSWPHDPFWQQFKRATATAAPTRSRWPCGRWPPAGPPSTRTRWRRRTWWSRPTGPPSPGPGRRGAQALRSATLDAARLPGVEPDLGTVEPGKLADLVVVDGDPCRPDVLAGLAGRIRRVYQGGVPVAGTGS